MKSLKDIKFNYEAFANVDIESILVRKGVEYTVHKSNGNLWARMRCPFHDDENPSFFLHLVHGGYNCYSGCGKGNWKDFCERIGWEFTATDSIAVDLIPDAIWKDCLTNISNMKNKGIENKISLPMPNGSKQIINGSKHYEYLKNRGIENLINLFDLNYTKNVDKAYGDNYINRIIIPCHDEKGRYVWPEGRMIVNTKKKKYYRPSGIMKTQYLFNLHRVIKAGFDWCIVVEGIIDAMLLWYWGLPAVCCYG